MTIGTLEPAAPSIAACLVEFVEMEVLLPGDTRHPPIGWAWTSNSNQSTASYQFISILCIPSKQIVRSCLVKSWTATKSNAEPNAEICRNIMCYKTILPDFTRHDTMTKDVAWEHYSHQREADHCPLHCPGFRYGPICSNSLQTSSDPINQHVLGICSALIQHLLILVWAPHNHNFRIERSHCLDLLDRQTHGAGILPVQP